MQRTRKPFRRTSSVRDAKLIIIASEGEITERQYFKGIAFSPKYKNPKVHVEILKREGGESDPKQCLSNLDEFNLVYKLNEFDELWLVCDVDRWGDKKLAEVNRLCKQKKYFIAVSNPCFETWLLLHHVDINNYSGKELNQMSPCQNVSAELRRVLGKYNKTNVDIDDYINQVELAIRQAEILDINNKDWPLKFGSKIYILMKSIIN